MTAPPIAYAAAALIIALIGGLAPIFADFKGNKERLKQLTGIAAGIILASAMLVVIPEGYELATADEHGSEEHESEDKLAGSVALVLLEVGDGDISASEGIEEIEELLGGHEDEHEDEHGHDEDSHDEESTEDSLSKHIEHAYPIHEHNHTRR